MENIRLLSYLRIRQIIGWLGIFLSGILWAGNFIFCREINPLESISDYYYSTMGDVFVGILFAIALFLYSYKGFDNNDDRITNAAAFCAVLVALFPTNNNLARLKCSFFGLDHSIVGYIHLLSASLFFLILSAYSYFWFTKFGKVKTQKKLKRNKIYRFCGIIMFLSIALMIVIFAFKIPKGNSIFWLETIGLVAFGISWLVKGETILADDFRTDQNII